MNKFKVILFDLDGTTINTEPLHEKSMLHALKDHNIDVDIERYRVDFLGASDFDIWNSFVKDYRKEVSYKDLIQKKNLYFEKIIKEYDDSHFLDLLTNGLLDALEYYKNMGCRLGLVTASDEFQAQSILNKIDIGRYFEVICTASDTFFSKPNPSPYYYAMRKLKTRTLDSLIFEDSYFGLQSALKTGATVISINSNDSVLSRNEFKEIMCYKDFRGLYE